MKNPNSSDDSLIILENKHNRPKYPSSFKNKSKHMLVEKGLLELNSNSKLKSLTKCLSKRLSNKPNTSHNGDNENITNHGLLKQYCIKGNDVLLRDINFIRNDKSRMLMINVNNKHHQTDTYTILYTKDVCPFTFKDPNAFILKAIDINKKLKSMTFQVENPDDKMVWLNKFGIDMELAKELLNFCINEVEKRRFQHGIKKRCEEKSNMKIDSDTLVEFIDNIANKHSLQMEKENKWTVGNLERLIQLVLNEMSQPLIGYTYQKSLRKLASDNFDNQIELEMKKIMSTLPNVNRAILIDLLGHMERLSKYYLIIMTSPKKVIYQIRRNICKRLAPIIFRLQPDLGKRIVSSKYVELLYQMMNFVNNSNLETI